MSIIMECVQVRNCALLGSLRNRAHVLAGATQIMGLSPGRNEHGPLLYLFPLERYCIVPPRV